MEQWKGSPWHVCKNVVILLEFDECMKLSELRFDRIQMLARVMNLHCHLRDNKWGKAIAEQIDKNARSVQLDHVAGYPRARVTVVVESPLRRWIWIESKRRQCTDMYDIEYENGSSLLFFVWTFRPFGPILPNAGNKR